MSAAASSQPAYSDQIKREIEKEVCALIADLKSKTQDAIEEFSEDWWRLEENEILPDYIELGSTLTVHRGKTLYSTGDTILGIPVKVVDYPPRTISVYQNTWVTDGKESERGERQDLCSSVTV